MTFVDPGAPGQVQPPPSPPYQQQPIVVNVPPQPEAPKPPVETLSLEEAQKMLEKVRKEEKDKLYPQIEELQNTVSSLTQERDERERLAQEAEQVRQLEEQKRQEDEMSLQERFQRQAEDWQRRFDELDEQRRLDQAVREKDVQLARLSEYRTRRISQEQEEGRIAPELADLVNGNSEEEVETSIALLQAKTDQLVQSMQAAGGGRPGPPVMPVSGSPTMGPEDLTGDREMSLTPEDIRNMSMDEYRRLQPQLTQAASRRVREQGLYAP